MVIRTSFYRQYDEQNIKNILYKDVLTEIQRGKQRHNRISHFRPLR